MKICNDTRLLRFSLRAFFLLLAAIFSCASAGATSEQGEPRAIPGRDMVWTGDTGNRRAVYFSSQGRDGAWTEPVMLSDESGGDNMLPCIVSASGGRKYVVWVTRENGHLQLEYTVFDGREWGKAQAVPGLPQDATMPFVAVDDKGVLWLVFAGNNGDTLDDIQCLRLENDAWTRPERVNGLNEVPDINPFIEIAQDGTIQITWEGYRDGYVLLTSKRQKDGKWTDEQLLSNAELENLQQQRKQAGEEELPAFVEDRSMLFIRNNNQ